jgi:hypothetical protein
MIVRLVPVAVAVGAALATACGCGLSAGPNEYVVHFAPGTPVEQARAVGEACPKFGNATLEPPARGNLASNRAYPVRYDITNASSQDKADLATCLQKFKIVRGVSESNDEA